MSDLYVVMIVTLVVWIGVFLYLLGLDRRVSRLARETKRRED